MPHIEVVPPSKGRQSIWRAATSIVVGAEHYRAPCIVVLWHVDVPDLLGMNVSDQQLGLGRSADERLAHDNERQVGEGGQVDHHSKLLRLIPQLFLSAADSTEGLSRTADQPRGQRRTTSAVDLLPTTAGSFPFCYPRDGGVRVHGGMCMSASSPRVLRKVADQQAGASPTLAPVDPLATGRGRRPPPARTPRS